MDQRSFSPSLGSWTCEHIREKAARGMRKPHREISITRRTKSPTRQRSVRIASCEKSNRSQECLELSSSMWKAQCINGHPPRCSSALRTPSHMCVCPMRMHKPNLLSPNFLNASSALISPFSLVSLHKHSRSHISKQASKAIESYRRRIKGRTNRSCRESKTERLMSIRNRRPNGSYR